MEIAAFNYVVGRTFEELRETVNHCASARILASSALLAESLQSAKREMNSMIHPPCLDQARQFRRSLLLSTEFVMLLQIVTHRVHLYHHWFSRFSLSGIGTIPKLNRGSQLEDALAATLDCFEYEIYDHRQRRGAAVRP